MNNLQADGWDFSSLKYIEITNAELTRRELSSGDIVFNRTNSKELVGKCEVFDREGVWVFASYLMRLRVDRTQAIPEFVAAFLNTPAGRLQIDRESRQIIGMSNINAEEIRTLQIPLPKLPEQRKLLATLNAARADRVTKIERATALLAGVDRFVLDALGLNLPSFDAQRTTYAIRARAAVTAKKLNPDYFHPERINAIRAVERGYTNERATTLLGVADFVRDQRPVEASDDYLGLANVQSNTGEWIESTEEDGKGLCYQYAKGDVLFARLRPYLNKVYRAEADGVCSTEFHVIRIRRDAKDRLLLMPDYLAAVMRSSLVLAQTRHMMTGNTHPRLTNDDVINLVVPVPDKTVQEKIAAEVVRRREGARQLREDARTLWTIARRRFEDELLGPDSSPDGMTAGLSNGGRR